MNSEKHGSARNPKALRPSPVDYAVVGARGITSLIPVLGPTFAELLGTVIPNQRLDRVVQFVAELEQCIGSLEDSLSDEQLHDGENAELIHEGFRQAAQSLSDERRRYIATLIANGLKPEGIEAAESRYLLRILDEISDVEVVWLRRYRHPTIGGDHDFRKTHEAVLAPVVAYQHSPREVLDKLALQESYKEHLAQLGLLKGRPKTDIQTGALEIDPSTGAVEVAYYTLTRLGMLLLREIGLDGNE